MKMLMLAALAAIASPALAQTTPPMPSSDPAMAPPPAGPPMAPMAPAAPATAPADAAAPAAMPDAAAAPAPMPADGAYPKCSRTVKDHCTERSTASGARKHPTPRG